MKEKLNKRRDPLELLRNEAENLLSTKASTPFSISKKSKLTNELLHEIEVFQVELEMQNDELRVSQEALEKEKLKFSGFFNLAPVGYFILSRLVLVEECNDTGSNLLNGKRGEIISSRFSNYISIEETEIFYQFIKKIIDTNTRQTCQLKMITRERTVFYGQLEGVMIEDPTKGKPSFYIAVVDITEKKIAEFKQRETSERLQMALKASLTGTWTVQPKAQLIELDGASSEMFGFSRRVTQINYMSLLSMVHKEDQGRVDKALRLAIQSNTNLNLEFRIILSDNRIRHLEARGHITEHYSEDNYFAGIFTDITLKKQLAREAEFLKEEKQKETLKTIIETQETERMRISTAIHDSVGQLLYAINLNLQKSDLSDSFIEQAKKLIDQTIQETRNISFELSPSILADYGIAVALKEIIKRLQLPGLQFSLRLSGFGVRLQLISEVFIFRIIQELMNNIIKHSKATEGSIELKKKKNTVFIKVCDNGVGFKTSDMKKGSGLFSIKNRLSLYNGTMKVTYTRKNGNCVAITILDIQ